MPIEMRYSTIAVRFATMPSFRRITILSMDYKIQKKNTHIDTTM